MKLQVREAIKLALHWYAVARETRDYERKAVCRAAIKQYWHRRNEENLYITIT